MEKSLYAQIVEKYFPQLVLNVVELLNGQRGATLPYFHKQWLDNVYSADGRWTSILAEYTRVAADVVALDSEIPLKQRDTVDFVSGNIPKLGQKLALTEKQMKDLDAILRDSNPQLSRVINILFGDTRRVIEAVWERIEDIFLSELSTGVGISERDNGTGVRIDMGFYDKNKFEVDTPWKGNPTTCLPLEDIQKVFDRAMDDNNTITDVFADDNALLPFYTSKEVRGQFAFNQGIGLTQDGVPVLDFDKARQVFATKWGVTLHRVARKIKTEINGQKNNHSPWAKGILAFTCDEKLGNLVYTDTAEATRRVGGVEYQIADEYILVSKYSKNDPLREFTMSQAMAVPVLNNVDRIYLLDTKVPEPTTSTSSTSSSSSTSSNAPTI